MPDMALLLQASTEVQTQCTTFMLSREGSLRGLLYTPGFKATSYGALSGIAAGILPGEQFAPALVQQCFF